MNLSLKLTGRQPLHTQWFPRRSCAGNTIRARFVLPRAVRCGPCLITKRYVCATKSFGTPLGILAARPADLRNATCVRPARFRPSRQVATRRSGPAEGRETLCTYWFLRFRADFTKRYTRAGFGAWGPLGWGYVCKILAVVTVSLTFSFASCWAFGAQFTKHQHAYAQIAVWRSKAAKRWNYSGFRTPSLHGFADAHNTL